MKKRIIAFSFITTFFLIACQSSKPVPVISTQTPRPTATRPFTATPQPTFYTPVPLATFRILIQTPVIISTPIVAKINTAKDLNFVIRHQIYPYPCFGDNFAKAPLTDANLASKLNFVEVNVQLDSNKYLVEEIAENASGNRKAWVACNDADHCEEKSYVQEYKSEKVYEITWGGQMLWRLIQRITWFNNDILTLLQSANPDRFLVMAINFAKREVLYEGIIFTENACAIPTPTS